MLTKPIVIALGILGIVVAAVLIQKYGLAQGFLSDRTSYHYDAPESWKIWHNDGYELKYPADFEVRTGDSARGVGLIDAPHARITFPADSFQEPRTNYVEAYAHVGVAHDARSLAKCYIVQNAEDPTGNSTLQSRITINGFEWRKRSVSEAAAGDIYASEVYRTIRDTRCYEILLIVHTGNIHNYEPGTAKEFDRGKALSILRQIRDTFQFAEQNPSG